MIRPDGYVLEWPLARLCGYRFEIKLPFSTLLGSSPATGDKVGMAISIVDDDGGDSDAVVSSLLGPGGPHSTDLWGTTLLLNE